MEYLEVGQVASESVFQKASGRAKFLLARATGGMLATGDARHLIEDLDRRGLNTRTRSDYEAARLLRRNTLAWGDKVVFAPSRFHRDTFFRDAFLCSRFANSAVFDTMVLNMFEQVQDPITGYIPTSRFAFRKGGFTLDDESTFYYPILAFIAQEEHGVKLDDRIIKAAKKASSYIVNLMDDEALVGVGTVVRNRTPGRSYWADELILPIGDVVAYKQGLAAVAVQAAYRLGIITDQSILERATEGYRTLSAPYGGRLPLSSMTGWIDVSALYPEYLSLALLGEAMLESGIVDRTVRSFSVGELYPDSKESYIRVITDSEGNYLPEEDFVHPPIGGFFMDTPGSYQNGGMWPLWTHAASSAYKMHGLKLSNLPEVLEISFDDRVLVFTTFLKHPSPESLHNERGEWERILPERINHTWNVDMFAQRESAKKFLKKTT